MTEAMARRIIAALYAANDRATDRDATFYRRDIICGKLSRYLK